MMNLNLITSLDSIGYGYVGRFLLIHLAPHCRSGAPGRTRVGHRTPRPSERRAQDTRAAKRHRPP
jgi:hypothetical protein